MNANCFCPYHANYPRVGAIVEEFITKANGRRKMEFKKMDNLFLSSGIFITFLFANYFGVESQNLTLYGIIGLTVSAYKLFRARERQRHTIIATILMGFIFSFVFAPLLELRLKIQPLETGAILSAMVIGGELTIFFIVNKLTGIDITIPADKKDIVKKK